MLGPGFKRTTSAWNVSMSAVCETGGCNVPLNINLQVCEINSVSKITLKVGSGMTVCLSWCLHFGGQRDCLGLLFFFLLWPWERTQAGGAPHFIWDTVRDLHLLGSSRQWLVVSDTEHQHGCSWWLPIKFKRSSILPDACENRVSLTWGEGGGSPP